MEYITGDRFAQDFIDRRIQALQSYLDRVSRHFVLQSAPLLHKFLSLQDAVELRSVTRQRSNSNNSRVFEAFSDVFINAFTRVKDIDPKFVGHKEMVDQFEESLTGVEKMHQKMLRLQSSISIILIDHRFGKRYG
jgi:sorting nexin-4